MTATQLTEEHLQQIAEAIDEARAENGEVIISFGVGRRFVKVTQPAKAIWGDYRAGDDEFQIRREITQYL